jgi:hypothetical protein
LRVAQKKEAPGLQPESLGNEILESDTLDNNAEAKKQAALESLERLTDQLATMADWRDQLQADLNSTYAFIDPETFDSLRDSVRLFCSIADKLCNSIGRRQ